MNIDKLRNQNFKSLTLPQLRDLINKADVAYHRPGCQSQLTDQEYDQLKKELKKQAPNDPLLTRVGTPYSAAELRTKVKHPIPMGSLDNTDDGIVGYQPWIEWLKLKIDDQNPVIMASLKIDGASVRASYVDGVLVQAAGRGNGEYGEDITANAARFKNLPTILAEPVTIDVRGEAILYTADFLAICERDKIPEEERSNSRNIGTGMLGRSDGQDCDLMRFLAFNVEGKEFTSEVEKFEFLKSIGFQVVPHQLCKTVEQFQAFYNQMVAGRDKLPFGIDGVVAVVDNITNQKKLLTDDIKSRLRPKYARAIKFDVKTATTKIIGVTLSIGHTRSIIPTAQLETVRVGAINGVGGVDVSNVLLNNWDEIKKLDVAIGDTVTIGLAGDIIPKCYGVVKKALDAERVLIDEPTQCPACNAPTSRMSRGKLGAVLYCTNVLCDTAAREKIDHWLGSSKKGVGILGVGEAVLDAIWKAKLVADPADLYTLAVDQLKDLKPNGKTKIGFANASKIVNNIQNKKQLPLHTFLGALGIDLLGGRRAEILIKAAGGKLDTLDDWRNTVMFNNLEIEGLGDTVKAAIINGMNENCDLIDKLLSVGVTIGERVPVVQIAEPSVDGGVPTNGVSQTENKPFMGASFCWTGTRELVEEVRNLGGEIKSGISKGLTYLVQLDPMSQSVKTQKAESYGTKIIGVEYLRDVIAGKKTLD